MYENGKTIKHQSAKVIIKTKQYIHFRTYRGISLPICFTIVALLARTAPDSDDAIFAMAADDPVRGPDALYITLDRGIPPSVVDRSGTVMVAPSTKKMIGL